MEGGTNELDRSLRFASWIEFLAVDFAYPEFDIWTQFVSDTLATCMISDALHNSHAIEVPIEKPSDIDEIFDDITYEKGFAPSVSLHAPRPSSRLGSSVIRLLHAFIGNDAFRRGLSNYLAEYSYKNAITDNLWFHLSSASNRPDLAEVLSTWTQQMGYPLLIVR